MTTDILGIIFIFGTAVALSFPLGRYISRVFKGEKTMLDFMSPLEKLFFRISGINPEEQWDWKKNIKALLTINFVWFILGMIILTTQNINSFLNPDGIPAMESTQAFNTVASFLTNTNLQHYSGETGASYFSQLMFLMFMQFVSAATGMASLALLFKGLSNRSGNELGNFYNLLVKSCTRILMPISLIIGIILIFNNMPMTFKGAEQIVTLQGDTVNVATGPVAAMIPIKELGTNGGGFFGPNSTHPFENPNYFTNIVENIAMLLIPLSMIFALGFFLNRKKFAYMIFWVMTAGFLFLAIPAIVLEIQGNPAITDLGIRQDMGSMEGKEVRIGAASSAFWGIANTVISCGSVNSMHDSWTPLSGMFAMLGMQLNAFYGGVGVGIINMFVFIVLAVFISGLMVGRTPELFGKKIEAKEVKIAILVAVAHHILILGGTALAVYIYNNTPAPDETLKWLNNPSYHGFSEMLNEFTSASANNGSGFEGLGDNTFFWNISTGIVMLLNRFIPIIGPIAIAGYLSQKKYIPESAGSMRIDSPIFGIVLFSVIVIIGALIFFPVLALGPISEYLLMIK